MASEGSVEQKLQILQKQLGKKQMFEEAVSSIKSLLVESYPSASPSLRKSIYSVVCRVATILQTRYTAPGFWVSGLGLFEEAERLVTESSEREHLKTCISRAREHLHEIENEPEVSESSQNNSRYLFEGHMTVDPEPPRPTWLIAQELLTTVAAADSSPVESQHNGTSQRANDLLGELISNLSEITDLHDLDFGLDAVPPRQPPASKQVVANLPIITITEEILAKMGSEAECSVCKEKLVINDKMQELPCKHMFHPPCLKPWLDEHNSCPICRSELKTDDCAYESWKEREKEAEEERKGAANAIRGGEYMYV